MPCHPSSWNLRRRPSIHLNPKFFHLWPKNSFRTEHILSTSYMSSWIFLLQKVISAKSAAIYSAKVRPGVKPPPSPPVEWSQPHLNHQSAHKALTNNLLGDSNLKPKEWKSSSLETQPPPNLLLNNRAFHRTATPRQVTLTLLPGGVLMRYSIQVLHCYRHRALA